MIEWLCPSLPRIHYVIIYLANTKTSNLSTLELAELCWAPDTKYYINTVQSIDGVCWYWPRGDDVLRIEESTLRVVVPDVGAGPGDAGAGQTEAEVLVVLSITHQCEAAPQQARQQHT